MASPENSVRRARVRRRSQFRSDISESISTGGLAHRIPRNVRSHPTPSLCSSLFGSFCLVLTILPVSFERIGRGRDGRCCAGWPWRCDGYGRDHGRDAADMIGAGAGAGRGRPGMDQGPGPPRVHQPWTALLPPVCAMIRGHFSSLLLCRPLS
ncbi:hypothetical protein BC827DRAFT_1186111 [Russula dissimulans]|nr:hypothetical protein BC827DRAFT_1186111 [Russula dissimulans]